MSSPIVIGDDLSMPVQLYKGGIEFAIPGTADVQAAIVDRDRTEVLAGPVTCLEAATGADWSTSLIIADFPESESADITAGLVYLEIQVDDNGKNTWFVSLAAVQGNIP